MDARITASMATDTEVNAMLDELLLIRRQMGITLAHLKEAVDRLLDRIALVAQTASKSIEEMGKTKADKVNIMS